MHWFFNRVEPVIVFGTAADAAKNRSLEISASDAAFRRSGYRALILTAMKERWFSRSDMSELEAVMRSDFETLLELKAIQNAMQVI